VIAVRILTLRTVKRKKYGSYGFNYKLKSNNTSFNQQRQNANSVRVYLMFIVTFAKRYAKFTKYELKVLKSSF
jgi:hypothetical protein